MWTSSSSLGRVSFITGGFVFDSPSGFNFAKWSALGGAKLGLGWNIHRFYLGAFVHSDWMDKTRWSVHALEHTAAGQATRGWFQTFQMDQDGGVAAKLGVLLSAKTLLYGVVGAVSGDFSLQSEIDTNNAGNPPYVFDTVRKNDEVGLELGLGLEQYLAEGFSFYVEDIYSAYPTMTFNQSLFQGVGAGAPTQAIMRVTVRPRLNKIVAGFNFNVQL